MSHKSANSSNKRQDSLKQGTLSFTTVKRVGSNNATSKPKSLKPTKVVPSPKSSSSVENSSIEDDSDDVEFFLSEDEDDDEIQDSSDVPGDHNRPTSPRTRAQTRAADKPATAKKSSQEPKIVLAATGNLGTIPSKASEARPNDVSKTVSGITPDEKPELDVKDRKWNKLYGEVRKKMGYIPPGESFEYYIVCDKRSLSFP
jgi:hypothetical protein